MKHNKLEWGRVRALRALLDRVKVYDAAMNDEANDGKNARCPEGGDYNALYSDVVSTLSDLLDNWKTRAWVN